MKVAFILTAFPVVSETFVLNQVTGLIDRGIDVTLFVIKKVDSNVVHPDVVKYKLADKIIPLGSNYGIMPKSKFKRIVNAFNIYKKASNSGRQLLLKTLNVKKFGKSALSLVNFYNASSFIDKPRSFDIVHCHFGHNGVLASNLKMAGVLQGKVVTVFHGHDVSQNRESNKQHYKNLFKHGDCFQPVSHKWAELLISIGCPEEKIQVHRMGVEVSGTVSEHIANGHTVQILSVARMVEKKGLEYALKALASVIEISPNLMYKIAGDGPLREKIEALISQLGLENNVSLLGWQDQASINQLMDETNIFLLPSVTSSDGDMEGVPVVLMEAMAKAIPVVSTLHSGIPELVTNEVSGILVEERNVKQLETALLQLIQQPHLRQQYGAAGRKEVLNNYSIDKLNDELVTCFNRLSQ